MKIIYSISKLIQSILKFLIPKRIIGVIQQQSVKLNLLNGELHSDESNPLLFQMYSSENEALFV